MERQDIEVKSEWYNRIHNELLMLKSTMSSGDYKKYKVEMVSRIVARVDSFSEICGECESARQEINNIVNDLRNLIQLSSKEARKNYYQTIDNITKHLKKEHKLITRGQYFGICIGIGLALSSGIGTAFGEPGIGPGIGIAIGVAIGYALEEKARREGRIL